MKQQQFLTSSYYITLQINNNRFRKHYISNRNTLNLISPELQQSHFAVGGRALGKSKQRIWGF